MLYAVFVAVCLSSMPARECRQRTALDWIAAPEAQRSLTGCMRHGLLYAATSHLVIEGSYTKVFCVPRRAGTVG